MKLNKYQSSKSKKKRYTKETITTKSQSLYKFNNIIKPQLSRKEIESHAVESKIKYHIVTVNHYIHYFQLCFVFDIQYSFLRLSYIYYIIVELCKNKKSYRCNLHLTLHACYTDHRCIR